MGVKRYSQNEISPGVPDEVTSLDFTSDEWGGVEQDSSMKIIKESTRATEYAKHTTIDNLTSTDTDKPVSANKAKELKDAQDILKGNVSTEGSVLKSIKDNAKNATFTPVGGVEATDIKGAIAELDSDKADKVTGAAAGNFASLDAEGNLLDSGKKDADYEDADSTILKQAGIVDNLTSTDTDKPLSANQGKVLKDVQDVIKGAGWTNENLTDHEERINTLEADKEDASNKLTAFQSTPDDVHYPSEKLVKGNLDALDTRIEVLEEFNPLESWADVQTAVRAGVVDKYLMVGDQLVADYNGTEFVWNVIGIDHPSVTPVDSEYTHTLTLQPQNCLFNAQFSAPQAMYNAVTALPAGTHIFTTEGVQYQVTTTVEIPAGGILHIVTRDEYVPLTLTSYNADRVTTIETGLVVTTATGSDTLTPINNHARMRYGSNNPIDNALRQFLNSSASVFNWESQGLYDMPSPYAGTGGFLYQLDPELVAVMGEVENKVALASYDGGGQVTVQDKAFLLSRVELGYYDDEGVTTGESVYEFYDGVIYAERIKLLSGSPHYWWLRSPSVSYVSGVRGVRTSGGLSYGSASYAYNSHGLAPACVIV